MIMPRLQALSNGPTDKADSIIRHTRSPKSRETAGARVTSSWSTRAISANKHSRTRTNKPKVSRHRHHHHRRPPQQLHPTTSEARKNPLELPEIVAMVLCYLSPNALLHARLVSRTWDRIAQELMFHRRAYHSSATTQACALPPALSSSSFHQRRSRFLAAGNTVQIHFSDGASGFSHTDPRYAEEIAKKRALQRKHFEEACLSGSKHAKLTGLEMHGSFDPMDLLRYQDHAADGITDCAKEASSADDAAALTVPFAASLSAVTVLDLTVQTPSFALSELDLVALLAGFPRLRHLAISLSSYVRVPAGSLRNSPALSQLSSFAHGQTMSAGSPFIRSPSPLFSMSNTFSSPTLSALDSSSSDSASISSSSSHSSPSFTTTPSSWQQHQGTYNVANALGLAITSAAAPMTMSDNYIGTSTAQKYPALSDTPVASTLRHVSLETLQTRGIQMSFQDMLFLLTLLPNLRGLEMAECLNPPWSMAELVQQLQRCCPRLHRFHMQPSHGQFSLEDHLVVVKGLPGLTELALDMPPPERVPRTMHPLAALSVDTLTTLHLGAFEYDERSMWHLHQFLCRSTQLRELHAKHVMFPIELLTEPAAAKALEDKLHKIGGDTSYTPLVDEGSNSSSNSNNSSHWACKDLVRLEIGFAKPKSLNLVQTKARQLCNVFEYLVQHLPNLAHLDANFNSLSLDKQGGVDQLKHLHRLETVHLVSRTDTHLARPQLDWLLANRPVQPSSLKKKNKKSAKSPKVKAFGRTMASEATTMTRGRPLTTMALPSPVPSGSLNPSSSDLSSMSPTMSPWASPLQTGVIGMPRSRSPSPAMGQRFSLTMSPILLPAPSLGLTRVATNLSEETDLEDLPDLAMESSVPQGGWFKSLSTKVKRLFKPNGGGDDGVHHDSVDMNDHDTQAEPASLSALEESLSAWVLPRLSQFHVTVYQQCPKQPAFLAEIKERIQKKRPALHVQIRTHSLHVQRRVRSEALNQLRL